MINWKHIWLDFLCPTMLAVVLFCVGFHVWDMDFSIPMIYSGKDDFTHGSFLIRALHWENSIWTDMHLGFPYMAEMYAFPHVPFLAVLWGYLLGLFTNSYGIAVNTYFLMTYVLATVVFAKVSRSLLMISYSASWVGGLLYAFSFFHLAHGLGGHFTAISYGMVPVVVWLCIRIASAQTINWGRKKIIVILIGLLVLCLSDPFYAFWGCILILIAGMYALFNYRHVNSNYRIAVFLLLFIVMVTGMLLFPAILYALTNHVQTAERTAFETWWWGLNIPSLFAPLTTENNIVLSWIRRTYIEGNVNPYLNIDYLGVFGIIGLFFLVYQLFLHQRKNEILEQLARFNACTIIVGVSGGIGLFIAVFFTAKIRVYDRISVYVYCFVILAFLYLLNSFISQYINVMKSSVYYILLVFVISFHLYDMQYFFHSELEHICVGPASKIGGDKRYYKKLSDIYEADREVVDFITKNISPKAKVLYLPYLDFPEEGKVGNYAKAVGVRFFSKDIYISSGNVYGTYNAELMKLKYDTENFKKILSYAEQDGYDVIIVDKVALKKPVQYIGKLQDILGISPVFDTAHWSLFTLANKQKGQYGELESISSIKWCKGFYGEEYEGNVPYQWASKNAVCWILSDSKRKFKLRFSLRVYGNEDTDITINGCGIRERVHVPSGVEVPVELYVDLSKGYQLDFMSSIRDKKTDVLSGRMLNFMVRDYKIEEE